MKLAQALIIRSDYQNKTYELKNRITSNAKVQEGEIASENPIELLNELKSILKELEELIKRINKTNNETKFEGNTTLADAICARDSIKRKRNILISVIEEASIRIDRYSQSEVKFISTINVSELQKECDLLSKKYRELDMKIQEKNWLTELM